MAGKKEIDQLLDQVREVGWPIDATGSGLWKVLPPQGSAIIVSASNTTGRAVANFKADLRRAGFNPDEIEARKAEKKAAALSAAQEANEIEMAKAEARIANMAKAEAAAEQAQKAAAETKKPVVVVTRTRKTVEESTVFDDAEAQEARRSWNIPPTDALFSGPRNIRPLAVPIKPPVTVTPFEAPKTPEVRVTNPTPSRTGYRSELVYVTKEWAEKALEKGQCRQRRVNDVNVAKLRHAMENHEFVENPSDHLLFDEHNCLVNGQHRLWAVSFADENLLAVHYPQGVPLHVTYGYPSALVNVIDTGKSRSVADTLNVDGFKNFGASSAAALRMVMCFDAAAAMEDGATLKKWTAWREITWTNKEFSEAAGGRYARLTEFDKVGQRLYTKAGGTRTAGNVASFLIDRDNPGGRPADPAQRITAATNQEFWDGVCFEVTLEPGDPRGALYRYFQNQRAQRNRPPQIGLLHLAHILRQYANWCQGITLNMSSVNENWPMPPVWQEGFRFINGELRQSKYPHRVPKPKG